MHINMKYYIVSIGAIFISLGIGILVGYNLNYDQELSKQQASVISDLDNKFDALKVTNDNLEKSLADLSDDYDKAIAFINDNVNNLVVGRLTDKNIGIISTNQDNDYTKEIKEIITTANGNVAFDITLNNNIFNEKKIEELATKLNLEIKDTKDIMAYIEEVKALLKGLTPFGEKIRIKVDNRNKSSVDKFWEWTRKGAPVICEIGMRDAEGGKVMVKERLKLGTPEGKEIIAREEFARGLSERLENIQHEMFVRAKARLENNIRTDIVTHEEFEKYFANANRFIKDGDKNAVTFVRGKWSGDPNSEELLKALKITIRCIPFDQSGSKGECLLTGAKDATVDVIYARSY